MFCWFLGLSGDAVDGGGADVLLGLVVGKI